jgi:hypothetical protein
MTKDYLFLVRTTEDIDYIPEGSGIYVTKELKKNYIGFWTSQMGTYLAKVPKDKCINPDEQDKKLKLILANLPKTNEILDGLIKKLK